MAEAEPAVGRIAQIWRYPVKSMAGERITASDVGPLGLHADRMWAVRDLELGATTGAKRLPALLRCTARFTAEPPRDAGPGNAPEVVIGLPCGEEVSSSDPSVHARLSEFVRRDVRLCPLPPVSDRKRYRGPMLTKADARRMMGVDPGEPLPDISMFPVRKLAELSRYVTPVGSYADVYPVHVVTFASLRTMARRTPGTDFDVRRFRPTVVVEAAGDGEFPEWEWCGGTLVSPQAELTADIPTIRCVMPTLEQPGLPRDPEVTRSVARHARRCLGVYGTVGKPGRIAEGDRLELRPPRHRPVAAGAGTRGRRLLVKAGNLAMPKGK